MTDEGIARGAVVAAVGRGPWQPADWDDMAQDARVAVWQAHEAYDGRGTFERYAHVRAKFAVIDGLRSRLGRHHPKVLDEADSLDFEFVRTGALTLAEVLPSPVPEPERVVCARETVTEVAAWLASVSPARAAAVRACDEGVSMMDVAEERGVGYSAVPQIRARGRAALRRVVAA